MEKEEISREPFELWLCYLKYSLCPVSWLVNFFKTVFNFGTVKQICEQAWIDWVKIMAFGIQFVPSV